jgi:two-component system, cell cycle sensor histidine kinase and response regulator CckA
MSRDRGARSEGHSTAALSQSAWESLCDGWPGYILTLDAHNCLTSLHRSAKSSGTGMETGDIGRNVFDLVAPDSGESLRALFDGVRASGETATLRSTLTFPHSAAGWYDAYCMPLPTASGHGGLLLLVNEASAQLASEAVLEKSERRIQALSARSAEGVWRTGPDPSTLRISAASERVLGRSAESLQREGLRNVHPDDVASLRTAFAALSATPGSTRTVEYRARHADGTWRWLESIGENLMDDPTVGSIVGNFRDVTDRRERDVERLAHDERYQMLFTDSPSPSLICDRETLRIVDANLACLRLYGYAREELVALTVYDLDGDRERVRLAFEAVASDFVALGEWTHRTKNETHVEVELFAHRLKAVPPAYLVVVREVTEARRLTEQLVQSQKMEAIGRLSGGIAHDFNNMLTAIFAYVELCLAPDADPHGFRADLEAIKSAAERASALTRQLLAFSRKQVMRMRSVDLNSAVVEIEKMLRHVIGEDVEFVTSLDPALGAVRADPTQMAQVILNLAMNARDAMPLGGRVTVETTNIELDTGHGREAGELVAGPYVCVSMTDTGSGMDERTRQHIFEPFFTTKALGKGTGLGLSTVFGIVKQTGGGIVVESRPGHGSTFRIYLPRTAERATPTSTPVPPPPIRGSGTLLLVEDDEHVRDALRRLLVDRGFHVVAVCGMAEALAFLDGAPPPIQLMVTDLVMPGGDGVSLAKQARTRLPGLRVLFMSGYTEHAVLDDLLQPGSNFIAKPFIGTELDAALRVLLGASGLTAPPGAPSPT